jgi:hypothetical protein
MPLLMKYSSRTSRMLMNPLFVNGRYIDQWETPINEWLVLAYGRDQTRIVIPPLLTNGALRLANRDPGWAIARIGERGGTALVSKEC